MADREAETPGSDNEDVTDLPRKAVTRSAKLATLPIGFAGRAALGLGKRLGGAPAEVVAAELQQRTADQLFRVLGELKGGAMKFGQAMSILESALPEELAGPYRATLTKLQDAAPPMPAAVVHRVIADDLGRQWRRRFRDFEDVPAAAASIGQVHRAVWKDGRDVAVKVQYPGAGEALRSDLNQISRVGRVFGSWIPGLDVGPLLDELRDRIGEEVDYHREAQSQQRFADVYADDPEFRVPPVVFGGERIIVSEWLEGRPLSQVIAAGSHRERNRAGLLYTRFLFSGPARAGLLHADPHPGNYRMTPDGRLGVLDYGLVARLSDGLPRPIGELLRRAVEGDHEAMLNGLREEGFVKPYIRIEPEEVYDYLAPFIEPARVERFHFDREWMRQQFARINDPRRPGYTIGLKLNLPPSYLLIHRVWLGGVAVLSQLDCEAPFRRELERWLPGFAE
jgi:predicted unusual protein kinase regulating ubiquinone biosynthesis (AarF/ABC1/UbiB family)